MDDDSAGNGHFRIVKALSPAGTSSGSKVPANTEGDYNLALEVLDW